MKEKDFDQTLRDRLESHDSAPADHVWDKINAKVNSLGKADDIFDEAVERKVQSLESEVPSHVWDNIQRDLERRKPRLLIPYMLTGLAILAILATIWWSVVTKDTTELSADQNHMENAENGSYAQLADFDAKDQKASNEAIVTNDFVQRDVDVDNQELNSNNETSIPDQINRASISKKVIEASNSPSDNITLQSSPNEQRNTPTSDISFAENNKILDEAVSKLSHQTATSGTTFSSQSSSSSQTNPSRINTTKTSNDQSNAVMNEDGSVRKEESITQRQIDQGYLFKEGRVENENNIELTNNQNILSNSSSSNANTESNIISNENENLSQQELRSSSKAVSLLTRGEKAQGKKKLIPLGNGKADGGMFIYDPCSVKGGKKKNRVHCFSFVKKSEITFADFTVGPQYSSKILKSRLGDGGPNNLLADRENTESYMFSYNVQARAGIKTNSGLTGTIGLSYDRYNERFEFFDPDEIRIITTTNIEGQTLEVRVEAIGERTIKHTNTLTFVSIPFTAGYMWEADKFNVGVHGGLSMNLLFFKGGRIVTDDGSAITLNGDAKKDVYKPSAGFSALGGLVFEYKIRDNLSFIAEPNIKYNLRSLTTDGYLIDQKYLTTGINIGLRTIINKKITQKKKYGNN